MHLTDMLLETIATFGFEAADRTVVASACVVVGRVDSEGFLGSADVRAEGACQCCWSPRSSDGRHRGYRHRSCRGRYVDDWCLRAVSAHERADGGGIMSVRNIGVGDVSIPVGRDWILNRWSRWK